MAVITPQTYSFADISATLNFPGYSAYSIQGQGLGEITITPATERTTQVPAADGAILTSKIAGDNGDVSITVQQTSPLHGWLNGVFNFLKNAPSSKWADGRFDISATGGMKDNWSLTGVAFTNRATQSYKAQGDLMTWNFKVANISTVSFLGVIPQPASSTGI